MIINGKTLLHMKPIKHMSTGKVKLFGLSCGLSEVGYDIRLKQEVTFQPPIGPHAKTKEEFYGFTTVDGVQTLGKTALASSIEEFQMPDCLWGELRNKSTLARRFVDTTIGTDVEPGWTGFLTIEIIFHGVEPITLPAGSPIAKVVFHQILESTNYAGKYSNQPNMPVEAIFK